MIFGPLLLVVGLIWLTMKRDRMTLVYSFYCILMGIVSSLASVASKIGQTAKGEAFGIIVLGCGLIGLMMNIGVIWRAYFLDRKTGETQIKT